MIRILNPEQRAAWLRWLATLSAALLAAVLARWGIVVPPPVIPPYQSPTNPEVSPDDDVPQPIAAIGRITFDNTGCTATVVGPRRLDGKYDVLTAAHCTVKVGQTGTLFLGDGKSVMVRVRARDATSDAAWCVTLDSSRKLPYALLADHEPELGEQIYHVGYGVDKPRNREDGIVTGLSNDGQTKFRLNVSSGDSGAAILLNSNSRIVSAVCCTRSPGSLADVWGPSLTAIKKLRLTSVQDEDIWIPHPIPIRP